MDEDDNTTNWRAARRPSCGIGGDNGNERMKGKVVNARWKGEGRE